MTKGTNNIIGITLFFILGLFSFAFSQESMTITTYYPSPYGVYGELAVDKNLTNNSATVTAFSVDVDESGTNTGTVTGLNVDVSGVASGTRYAATFQGGNVGIGTTTPVGKLDVNSSLASTAWTAVTFGTGWSNYGGGWQAVQYKKFGDLVFLRGLATSGASAWASYPTITSPP